MTAVVEVNVGKVEASQQGIEWWLAFEERMRPAGRIRDAKMACVIGGVVEVACDSTEHARWLVEHMTTFGEVPASALRVRESSAGAA
jgi:hypothetical protein